VVDANVELSSVIDRVNLELAGLGVADRPSQARLAWAIGVVRYAEGDLAAAREELTAAAKVFEEIHDGRAREMVMAVLREIAYPIRPRDPESDRPVEAETEYGSPAS
jgi:hypothetical protein